MILDKYEQPRRYGRVVTLWSLMREESVFGLIATYSTRTRNVTGVTTATYSFRAGDLHQ